MHTLDHLLPRVRTTVRGVGETDNGVFTAGGRTGTAARAQKVILPVRSVPVPRENSAASAGSKVFQKISGPLPSTVE